MVTLKKDGSTKHVSNEHLIELLINAGWQKEALTGEQVKEVKNGKSGKSGN